MYCLEPCPLSSANPIFPKLPSWIDAMLARQNHHVRKTFGILFSPKDYSKDALATIKDNQNPLHHILLPSSSIGTLKSSAHSPPSQSPSLLSEPPAQPPPLKVRQYAEYLSPVNAPPAINADELKHVPENSLAFKCLPSANTRPFAGFSMDLKVSQKSGKKRKFGSGMDLVEF